jgi:hypothetical protein
MYARRRSGRGARSSHDLDVDERTGDSPQRLLNPAANIAQSDADSWRRGLDAMRLSLRRHRARVVGELSGRGRVLPHDLRTGTVGLREALNHVRSYLEALELAIDRYMTEAGGYDEWQRARAAAIELGAACIDLLPLAAGVVGAPSRDLVAVNVETCAESVASC